MLPKFVAWARRKISSSGDDFPTCIVLTTENFDGWSNASATIIMVIPTSGRERSAPGGLFLPVRRPVSGAVECYPPE